MIEDYFFVSYNFLATPVWTRQFSLIDFIISILSSFFKILRLIRVYFEDFNTP